MSPLLAVLTLAFSFSVSSSQEQPRGVSDWKSELGNERARVFVTGPADAVRAHLVWRRRDASPEKKAIIVVDGTTGLPVSNVYTVNVNSQYGDVVFQPISTPGEYFVYYMPFKTSGSPYFPVVTYPSPHDDSDPNWVVRNALKTDAWKALPEVKLIDIQARGEFNRSDPMEVIASEAEIDHLMKAHSGSPFLVFPEDRAHAIRMRQDLPQRWIQNGPTNSFSASARRGEFLCFQLGVWACLKSLEDVNVKFGDLSDGKGHTVPASAFRCINLGGADWLGRSFTKKVNVPQGEIAALWCGLQVAPNETPGLYHGTAVLSAKGVEQRTIHLEFEIKPEAAVDSGDANPFDLTRLRWLDSTIGIDDEVVAPYTPLKVSGNTVECLQRKVQFGSDGLPSSIVSNGHEILSRPISLVVDATGVKWTTVRTSPVGQTRASATHDVNTQSGSLTMDCASQMEADGYINYKITLTASTFAKLNNVTLEIPVRKDVAKYLMGMGRKGGYRPSDWTWNWDKGYANNMVWMGDVEAGLQCKLKGPTDSWDLFHLSSIPDAWANSGHGGCSITEDGEDTVLLKAYCGPRELAAGQTLHFNFGLLITPVKPLDPAHWGQRYDHEYVSPEKVKQNGATIINIHQGNELNPNINYPFLATDKLAAYVKQAHALGLKVKIYYTVRELSNRVAEMWPLRSLGQEVFADGPAGGDSWLQEHLVSHYQPAWHTPLADGSVDAAIATVGLSRWHNYYLEGLHWLIKNVGIDGLYLDGIGYDREIMKRVRKVMDRSHPGCLIDFHCGNSFQPQYGMNSCANQFMEHFPYINSLWFGEGYDYNESPDYWLTEISGIPYGLYGEMLQDNGNPWRGMVYGMTARYYSGADPKHIWALWDSFGIASAKMFGYWSPECPVHTSDAKVLATAYVHPNQVLIALASWNKNPTKVKLEIDWKALGMDPAHVSIEAPAVNGFQNAATFAADADIPVEPGRGWMLLVKRTP